jgi:capsular polysaccharide biosynthesis protein/Mrp family chromosome partitioning ATPase
MDGARMAAALRSSALAVAVIVIAVTVLVLLVSVSAPARYRGVARIVQDPASVAAGAAADSDQRSLATSLAFLNTPAVRQAAANEVSGITAASLEHKVSGVVESGANVIDVTATDASPSRAAAIANAMARAFLERRAEVERISIGRARAALEDELIPGTPADQAAAIRSQLSELAIQSANAGSDLQLAEEAPPPTSPYAPRPLRNAVIAFFATLFVAVVAVLVLERLRPRARGALALGRLTDVPVLATLPSARRSSRRRRASSRLRTLGRRLPETLGQPLEAAGAHLDGKATTGAEQERREADKAMWSLVGAILLELRPARRHVLLVASPRQGQGSARVAAGLARALVKAGHTTLALSTDSGSTELARELAVSSEPGLAEAADWVADPQLRLSVIHGRDGVAIVPQNGMPARGAGLLGPGAVDGLFASLADTDYGYVIIETPGLLTSPEPRLLARHADAIVLACPESAPEADIMDARAVLTPLAIRILGMVVTPADGSAEPVLEPVPSDGALVQRGEDLGHPERALSASSPEPPDTDLASAEPVLSQPVSRDGALEQEREDLEHPESAPSGSPPEPSNNDLASAELDAVAVAEQMSIAEREAREVLERLRAADRPLTTAEVRTALGDPPAARVRSSLRRLVDRGEVVRNGHGRKGDPYVYVNADR